MPKSCWIWSERDRTRLVTELVMQEQSNDSRLVLGELTVEKAATQLADEIKKVSGHDQAAIVVEFLDTLGDQGEEFDEKELLGELQRREAKGMNGSVSWSELRDMP